MKITIFWLEKPTLQLFFMVILQCQKMGSVILYHDPLIQLLWYENEWLKTWLPLKKALEPRVMPHGSFLCPTMKPTVIFQRNASYSLFLKKHDKFLSTFSCNLEKDYVKKNYFHTLPPSLFAGKLVTCGFWGCHLRPLTLSFVASEPLICHKWEPQSIALTTQKHSFHTLKRCKENGSLW